MEVALAPDRVQGAHIRVSRGTLALAYGASEYLRQLSNLQLEAFTNAVSFDAV